MFGIQVIEDLRRTVAAVTAAPAELATAAQSRDALRHIQAAQDALDAAKAAHLSALSDNRGYEDDGASTLAGWTRRELRLPAREARALVAAGRTTAQLRKVQESARAGRIRLEHLRVFSYGLKHIGTKRISDEQDWLVDVAESCDPDALHDTMRKLRDAVFPDDLDRNWVRGMSKQDVGLNPVPDGWHLTGFLNTVTGAKLKQLLESWGTPRDAHDDRVVSQRRIDGLDAHLNAYLETGLPSDKGVRPQLHITVDFDTVLAQLVDAGGQPGGTHDTGSDVAGQIPARLTGFGAIGPQLLSYLTCGSDVTGILVGGQVPAPVPHLRILNVGDTERFATPRQRKAILTRQDGICATPGCTHTHLEIHHVTWISHGGRTDLEDLIGLCTACHHLVHRDLLRVERPAAGGFESRRPNGQVIDNDAELARVATDDRIRDHPRPGRHKHQHRRRRPGEELRRDCA